MTRRCPDCGAELGARRLRDGCDVCETRQRAAIAVAATLAKRAELLAALRARLDPGPQLDGLNV